MRQKKITFISFYGTADSMAAAARLSRTVAFLRDKDWTVSVVTPEGDRGLFSFKVKVLKHANHLDLLISMAKRALKERADLYFVSAPPLSMLIPAILVKWLTKAPVVFEERDLLTINPLLTFKMIRGNFLMRFSERWFLRKANALITATEYIKNAIEDEWPELKRSAKIVAVPNGFWRRDYSFIEHLGNLDRTGPVRFIHAGNFYGSRNPLPILEALNLLRERFPDVDLRSKLQFVFIGLFPRSDEREAFEALAKKYKVRELFELIDLKPRPEVLTEIYKSDIALLITHSSGSESTVPAKLYEYIALGRPVLAISHDPIVKSAMNKHSLGWCIPHAEVAKIADCLETIIGDPTVIRSKKMPGLNLSDYDTEKHLERLNELLSSMVRF